MQGQKGKLSKERNIIDNKKYHYIGYTDFETIFPKGNFQYHEQGNYRENNIYSYTICQIEQYLKEY